MEIGHGIWSSGTERGIWLEVGFFGVVKNKRRSCVHKKRIAGIKHRGGRGYNNDRREKLRRGEEYDIQNRERSSKKNRHVISGLLEIGWK